MVFTSIYSNESLPHKIQTIGFCFPIPNHKPWQMEISFMQHTLIGIWQKLTVCPLNQVNIPFTNGKKQGIFTPCYAINLTFFKTKKATKR